MRPPHETAIYTWTGHRLYIKWLAYIWEKFKLWEIKQLWQTHVRYIFEHAHFVLDIFFPLLSFHFGCAARVFSRNIANRGSPLASVGTNVRLVEKSSKEDKVAEVHGQREFDVEPRNVTLLFTLLQVLSSPDIDSTADNHLRQLTWSDEHGDVLPRLISHGTQCVIWVHDGVYAVVHDDIPACGRRVFGVGEPRVE